MCVDIERGQKMVAYYLELELQAFMIYKVWVLGTECGPFGKARNALYH